MRNVLIVISGPSGVGKGTLAKMLVNESEKIALSISCTTRLPRGGETDGKDYYFLEKGEFLSKINNGDFLEYSEHFGNYYGTLKSSVSKMLELKDVLLEIDVNGGLNVKKEFPNAVLIFLAPPSREELKNRLIGRNTESEEKINQRLERVEFELNQQSKYDYVVVNDSLDKAYKDIIEIINKERNKKEI